MSTVASYARRPEPSARPSTRRRTSLAEAPTNEATGRPAVTPMMRRRKTRRVLVVIDRAIIDVASVPEAVLQAEAWADQVRVIAPVLTSRTSWLTNDDVDARRAATDRLNSVLHRMRVDQGIWASGSLGDESPLTAIEDALVEFPADQLIMIMHDDDRHTWHERGLAAQVRQRYAGRLTEVIVAGNGSVCIS